MNTENKRQSLVNRIKASDDYKSFAGILENKKSNEEAAKLILESHAGRLTMKQLDFVFDLIDEPYPCVLGGKPVTGPWFGRLLKRNAQNFFNKSEEEINSWFKIMLDRQIPAVRRMDLLQGEQYKIKGISVGFVTLMLYILEKKNYLIWFKTFMKALRSCILIWANIQAVLISIFTLIKRPWNSPWNSALSLPRWTGYFQQGLRK